MRMNIEIDEALLENVMERSKAKTKREAVHLALKTYQKILAQRDMLSLRGKVVWEGNLDEMRADRTFD
jgi:Arc/MetJ family transcription regulator